MQFHVVIPLYRAHNWLAANLECLSERAHHPFFVTVVDMSDTGADKRATFGICDDSDTIIPLDVGNAKGGEPIAQALRVGVESNPTADITITVDPDALVLRENWTGHLINIFADPKVIAAGINPRSYSKEFGGNVEWNWCAFRTDYWRQHIGNFLWRRVDIGHLFGDSAKKTGHKIHTFPMISMPIEGKPAAFCGDAEGLWAFHAFFSSRKHRDHLPPSDRKGILTEEEEEKIIADCLERT